MKEFDDEDPAHWNQKINKENDIKLWLRKNGSKFSEKSPFGKVTVTIGKGSIANLYKVLNDIDIRMRWDSGLACMEEIPTQGEESFKLIYTLSKSPMKSIANRSFLDKRTCFFHEGDLYSYFSFAPEEIYPVKDENKKSDVRADSIIGLQRISKQEDGTLLFYGYTQTDIKMALLGNLISMFLPKTMNDWAKNIRKALNAIENGNFDEVFPPKNN